MGLDRFSIRKFNQNHDEKGLFSSTDSSGASELIGEAPERDTGTATAGPGGVLPPDFNASPFKGFSKEVEEGSVTYDGAYTTRQQVADMVKSCHSCGFNIVDSSVQKVPGAGDSFVMEGKDGRWMEVQTKPSARYALGSYSVTFYRQADASGYPFKNTIQADKQREADFIKEQETMGTTKGENMNIAILATKAVHRGVPAKKGEPGYVDVGSAATNVSSGIDYSKVLDARPYFEAGQQTSPEMAASLSELAASALSRMPVDERERFQGQIEKYRSIDQVPPALMAVMSAWG